ncbi:lipid-transfer protein [Oceanicoccus sp. KOV_DT_Chl]|uniref:thiolase C-terminal domain-containing protein n=1 Tax=Oceanicoccus sp. KOV_DT_Chl TaxID=1904639 RepID=UPI000C7B5FA9|nr:lipid-transfer protein [Oceanicoccus sp. KOV_DT_Chl]
MVKDKAAIVGIGSTEFSKNSGRSELQLSAEAVKAALDDAGLKPSDVDGMTTFTMDTTDEIELARAVGIGDITFYSRVPHGGGAATGLIHQAVMAIASGMCETVVCYRGLNGRSGHRFSEGVSGEITTSDAIHWGWYTPSGLMTPASWVSMYSERYMHLAGRERVQEALFEIAYTTRQHGASNPAAMFHGHPFDRAEYDAQKKIVGPLKLYDCCLESDGASAVVITRSDKAKDCKNGGVSIKGVGQCAAANMESMTSFYRDEIAAIPSMDVGARVAYEQSGLTVDDIDAAVIYDAFTPIVLWQLESWGFAEKGEAADFVNAGNLRLDGRLPCNTHGGQLSEAYIHGVNGIVEATRLVRGTSVNQPKKDVNHALVTSGVGVPTGGAILGKM